MNNEEIKNYNRLCAEFLGNKIDFNVADWSKYDDKSLTEHWNNNDKTWVHTPKGQGLPWYKVKHRNNFYQLFTDFTFQKLKKSDIELGGEYNGKYYELKDMQFHSDWNWIMMVVEAIENYSNTVEGYKYQVDIQNNHCLIERSDCCGGKRFYSKTKKEAVVQAINQFLIWYNENK